MTASQKPDIRRREIEDADLPSVADCLTRNFHDRTREYWTRGLARMASRPRVQDCPRFGQLIESGGRVVGVLLQIFSTRDGPEGPRLQCNLSSWCVDEEYRGFGFLLHQGAVKRANVTYINISSAPYTRKTVEAFGFRRYTCGQMIFAPLMSPAIPGVRIVEFSEMSPEAALLTPWERRLLADHAALGCRALLGVRDGRVTPFVLQWRTAFRTNYPRDQLLTSREPNELTRVLVRALMPGVQVLYCRSEPELAEFARALGVYCAKHGRFVVFIDADGPIEGIKGRFVPGREPRYFKGPETPAPSDLAYTELAILGR